MKQSILILFLTVVSLDLIVSAALAMPAHQPAQPDLVPLDISWPELVNPADQVVFTLKYANNGSADVATDASATFALGLRSDDESDQEVGQLFEGELASVSGLAAGATRIVTGTLAAPAEGQYVVVAQLDTTNAIPEADETNNMLRKEEFTVTSPLPPGVANLLAGLGLFAAIMAIVAVGTEVVIDSLRVLLGMKRKVTAMEALKQLERQLPGQLATLGVGAPQLKEFQEQVEQLRKTLTPVGRIVDARQKITSGQVGQVIQGILVDRLAETGKGAFDQFVDQLNNLSVDDKRRAKELFQKQDLQVTLNKLLSQGIADPDQALREALESLKERLEGSAVADKFSQRTEELAGQWRQAFQRQADAIATEVTSQVVAKLKEMSRGLALSAAIKQPFIAGVNKVLDEQRQAIVRSIEQINLSDICGVLQRLFQENGPALAADWLEQSSQKLLQEGSQSVLGLFDKELKPLLENDLGLDQSLVEQARTELAKAMGYLEEKAQAATSQYITGLKALLLAVEERRNQTQSPSRKVWRALRGSSLPVVAVIPVFILSLILWSLRARLGLPASIILLVLGNLLAGWLAWHFIMQAAGSKVQVKLDELRQSAAKQANFREIARDFQLDASVRRRAVVLLDLCRAHEVANPTGQGQLVVYQSPTQIARRHGLNELAVDRWVMRSDRLAKTGWKWHRDPYALWLALGDVVGALEAWWNYLLRRKNELGQVAQTVENKIESLKATNLAAILQEREDKHRDEEDSRLRWLRVISVFVGIGLAYLLQVDAAELLDSVIPGIAGTINIFRLSLPPNMLGWGRTPPNFELTAGIILTGLAASAGSAFWHDQLDRLQAAKKGAEAAAKLLEQAKKFPELGE